MLARVSNDLLRVGDDALALQQRDNLIDRFAHDGHVLGERVGHSFHGKREGRGIRAAHLGGRGHERPMRKAGPRIFPEPALLKGNVRQFGIGLVVDVEGGLPVVSLDVGELEETVELVEFSCLN